ncbi:hypothetical protein ABZ383_16360 [Streptomyces sp. NPDC005900]|uniref:hypothetical protein n=1 Tax=unclassified Streptomyces TaxID=2593676 RepID=UPI0034006B2B
MFRDVSIVQQLGVAVLAVATAVWAVGLVRVMRREHPQAGAGRQAHGLGVLPGQQGPPHWESVELTSAERAAFAGLVRQFGERRP